MKLSKVKTYKDLEALGIGRVIGDIGYRGGNIGFSSKDIAAWLDVPEATLPKYYGAGCNYLGGGVRGAIFTSGFSSEITGQKARKLEALAAACVRVYESIENEGGLNDEEYPDGDTNWDAKATKGTRRSGTISAY